jgi:prepilin-type N-terminal cleavage/methylation domain-containing protein
MTCKFLELCNNLKRSMKIHRSAGYSLIEVMIAVGVLAVVALGISISFNNYHNINTKIVISNTCNDVSADALQYMLNFGVSDHILPIVKTAPGDVTHDIANIAAGLTSTAEKNTLNGDPSGSGVIFQPNVVKPIFLAADLPTSPPTPGANLYPQLYNSQYIVNATTVAQMLYNSDNTYCTGATGVDVTSTIFKGSAVTKDLASVFLKIQPVDLASNQLQTCVTSPIFSAPRRLAPKPGNILGLGMPFNVRDNPSNDASADKFKIGGDSDLGFFITLTVNVAKNGATKTCQVTSKLQHQRDTSPPPKPVFQTPTAGTVATPIPLRISTSSSLTSCDTDGAGYKNLIVTMNTASFSYEPGSVILCQTQIDNGVGTYPAVSFFPPAGFSELVPCGDQVYFQLVKGGPKYYAVDHSDLTNPAKPIIILEFDGLPADTRYNLRAVAIDTAGNISANPAYITPDQQGVIIDATRPVVGNMTPATNLIGLPQDNVRGRLTNAINPGGSFRPEVNYLQCDFVPGGGAQALTDVPKWFGNYLPSTFPENWKNCSKCNVDGLVTSCNIVGSTTGPYPASNQCEGDGKSPTLSQGTHVMNLYGQDVCGVSSVPGNQPWYDSQTFYGLDYSGGLTKTVTKGGLFPSMGRQSLYFDKTLGSPLFTDETINLTTPGDIGSHWFSQCDCSNTYVKDNLACAPSTHHVACDATNNVIDFEGNLADVCNRQMKLTTDFEIHGDVGDSCGTISCNPSLYCPQSTGSGYTIGKCAPYIGVTNCSTPSDALCYPGAVGTCPPTELFSCSGSVATCGGNAIYSGCPSTCGTTTGSGCRMGAWVWTTNGCNTSGCNTGSGCTAGGCVGTVGIACSIPYDCLVWTDTGPDFCDGFASTCSVRGTITGAATNPACSADPRMIANMCGGVSTSTTTITVTTTSSTTTTTMGCAGSPPSSGVALNPGSPVNFSTLTPALNNPLFSSSAFYSAGPWCASTGAGACGGAGLAASDYCLGNFYQCIVVSGSYIWSPYGAYIKDPCSPGCGSVCNSTTTTTTDTSTSTTSDSSTSTSTSSSTTTTCAFCTTPTPTPTPCPPNSGNDIYLAPGATHTFNVAIASPNYAPGNAQYAPVPAPAYSQGPVYLPAIGFGNALQNTGLGYISSGPFGCVATNASPSSYDQAQNAVDAFFTGSGYYSICNIHPGSSGAPMTITLSSNPDLTTAWIDSATYPMSFNTNYGATVSDNNTYNIHYCGVRDPRLCSPTCDMRLANRLCDTIAFPDDCPATSPSHSATYCHGSNTDHSQPPCCLASGSPLATDTCDTSTAAVTIPSIDHSQCCSRNHKTLSLPNCERYDFSTSNVSNSMSEYQCQ